MNFIKELFKRPKYSDKKIRQEIKKLFNKELSSKEVDEIKSFISRYSLSTLDTSLEMFYSKKLDSLLLKVKTKQEINNIKKNNKLINDYEKALFYHKLDFNTDEGLLVILDQYSSRIKTKENEQCKTQPQDYVITHST
jgi:hypothetical protein